VRALISVTDKTGIEELAKNLSDLGIEIVSTGGTYKKISDAGVNAIEIDQITNFPEILEGRVKTLSPYVHGGILYKRDDENHINTINEHDIKPIDIVVVNLYEFQKALDFLQVEDYNSALPLLKEAWELSDKKNSDVALLYAETYIAMKKTEPAADILAQIPIQDRDSRWHGLQAQIELLIKAADTPEIQQLQADYAKNPTPEIALKLAVQLHQANRNEEALDLLFSILKQDLSAENGEVKQQFLSILSAIGNADPITNKYRRLLYSLLY